MHGDRPPGDGARDRGRPARGARADRGAGAGRRAGAGSRLITEPLLGWRVWQVDRGRLASWTRGARWPAQERLEARCPLRGRAPAAGHRCGIYAVRTRELAEGLLAEIRLPAPRPVVVGRVSLWGRVFENTHGWRAQFAYPYELFVLGGDTATLRGLRDAYAVDVLSLS